MKSQNVYHTQKMYFFLILQTFDISLEPHIFKLL